MYVRIILVLSAIAFALLSLFFSPDYSSSSKVRLLPIKDGAIGPESIVFDITGDGPYTGVSDGRILKWQGVEQGWIDYASVTSQELLETCKGSKDPKREHVCGRPLGLHFGKQGELYVADAYHGLLVVTAGDKFATPVVTETQGRSLRFTNSLDVDERTGVVYFTDSSKRFQRREFMSAVISGDKTGRLMSFNLVTKEVRVVLDGLSFPNGVALSKDGTFLILAETTTCRVLRYWIQPPADSSSARNGGDIEVVAELPGFPDNIRRSPRGGFWVALHSRRSRFVAWALSVAWIQRLILEFGTQRLGVDLQRVSKMVGRWNGAASAVRVSGEGEVLEVLEGVGDRRMRFISQVEERNGTLWLGSVIMPFAGVYPLAA
ncbi:protein STRICTOSIDINE SYNTHASE-LIKE 10-like isoform X2 [Zingiber officinale]|uniref:protein STRICTOSIDINE SYNTHASE-LIKE 10-like isoform X2 n=1 Tax=Zingiber officinale TaxID=94328 RepID=UPI001C4D7AEE|nr:protein STRICTOSIDINE SYNTHASE-LIKE 10-like isoform X2 [Zingiber officinale]